MNARDALPVVQLQYLSALPIVIMEWYEFVTLGAARPCETGVAVYILSVIDENRVGSHYDRYVTMLLCPFRRAISFVVQPSTFLPKSIFACPTSTSRDTRLRLPLDAAYQTGLIPK